MLRSGGGWGFRGRKGACWSCSGSLAPPSVQRKVHMIEASATSVEMRTTIEQGKRVPRFFT